MRISINKDDLVYPYFVIEGKNRKQGIKSFPGVFRLSIDYLLKDIAAARALGLKKILLFGIPQEKDGRARQAYARDNITARAIRKIKKEFRSMELITDVCLCAYTSHGHCGIIKSPSHQVTKSQVKIDNKETLEILAKIALTHAEAGADWVAPSAMAKRQVFAIRKLLDKEGYRRTKILGYSAKFASNFYGPFRQAADSAPAFGDRSGYQLGFGDPTAALKEIAEDIKEGADAVMVKPALGYLDIVRQAKQKFTFPLAAYNVSGEYAMVKYGAKLGLWDEKKTVFEVLTAIKRSGADIIITYHAKDIARWLNEQEQ